MVVCAISDRRAMRVTPGRRWYVRSYASLDPLHVASEAMPDGSGDVVFGQQGAIQESILNAWRAGFYRVGHARRVERILLATLLRRHAQPLPRDKDAPAIRKLLQSGLRTRAPGRRAEALACLLRIDDRTFEEVAGGLGNHLSGIRALGIAGIWRSLGVAGACALLRGLDANYTMRRATLQALSRLGRPAVVSVIQAWAVLPPARTGLVVEALGHIPDDLLAGALADALLADDPTAGVAVCQEVGLRPRLRRLGVVGGVAGAGVAGGGGGGGPPPPPHNLVGARAAAEPDLVGRLLALVRGRGDRARFWGAEALGILAVGVIADRLRKAVAGADAGDFPTAVLLAYLGDPAGIAALCEQVGLHGDACQVAAGALGRLDAAGAPALEGLERALWAETEEESRAALEHAIGRIRRALRTAPTELEAAPAPEGSGTELETAGVPAGSGTQMVAPPVRRGTGVAAAPDAAGRGRDPEAKRDPEGRRSAVPGRKERGR